MRSKRRCSCVLQFTRLHAVSCVLHRPTSRVIHHSRLIFLHFFCLYTLLHFHEKGMAHLPAPTFYIFRKTGREQHHRVSQDTTCERMCWNSNIFVPVHTLSNLFAVNTGFHAATTLVSHMSRRPHFYILDVAVNFTLSTADLCQDLLTP